MPKHSEIGTATTASEGAAKSDTVLVLAAVIRGRGGYLVCRRPENKRHGGLWEFPGGKLEPGESLFDAACRELREELAVAVTEVANPLFSIQDPGSQFHIQFVPVVVSGEPQCLEHSALRWADLAELATIELAPSDRRFLEFLQHG